MTTLLAPTASVALPLSERLLTLYEPPFSVSVPPFIDTLPSEIVAPLGVIVVLLPTVAHSAGSETAAHMLAVVLMVVIGGSGFGRSGVVKVIACGNWIVPADTFALPLWLNALTDPFEHAPTPVRGVDS